LLAFRSRCKLEAVRGPFLILALGFACRSGTLPLSPAGSSKDEGHGLLAQASTRLMTGEETDDRLFDDRRAQTYGDRRQAADASHCSSRPWR
jgi:hypothetical protein